MSKAAIGLARLCLDPTTADSVVRLGGLDKLFPLAEVSNNSIFNVEIYKKNSLLTLSLVQALLHALCVGGGVKKSNGWEFEIGDNRAKVVMCVGAGSESHMSATPPPTTAWRALSLIQQFHQNPGPVHLKV